MSLERLRGVQPGRIGLSLGSLAGQPAAVEREVVAEMEQLGYGTLWYGESIGRESFAHGAILLGATDQLVIASGIANIWARDPQAMASGGRALAEAWPRRFILGLGVSHQTMVEGRGHRYERPAATMGEYVDAMSRSTWRGPAVEMPPIVLAALGPRMVAIASQKAAGDYLYFTTTQHVRHVRQAMGAAPFIAAEVPVVLATSRSSARSIGDPHMAVYLSMPNYINNLRRLGWNDDALNLPGSDRLFDEIVAWGGTDSVREKVVALTVAGADQVVLNPVTADPNTPYVRELQQLSALTG